MLNNFKSSCKTTINCCKQLSIIQILKLLIQSIAFIIFLPVFKLTSFEKNMDNDTKKKLFKETVLSLIPYLKEFLGLEDLPTIYDDIAYSYYIGMFVSAEDDSINPTIEYVETYPSSIIYNGRYNYDHGKCVLLLFSGNLFLYVANSKFLFKLFTANIIAHELTHYKQFLNDHKYKDATDNYIKAEACLGKYMEQPIEKEADNMAFKFVYKYFFKIIKI